MKEFKERRYLKRHTCLQKPPADVRPQSVSQSDEGLPLKVSQSDECLQLNVSRFDEGLSQKVFQSDEGITKKVFQYDEGLPLPLAVDTSTPHYHTPADTMQIRTYYYRGAEANSEILSELRLNSYETKVIIAKGNFILIIKIV